ncbi:MAG TPA: GNAT family N-acetyltransferase [Terriglobales bacterium]|nr:GNAT family N-acetyltransferase [Terriglobales bacterium]
MLKLHQVNANPEWWRRLERFPDRLVYHTQEWIHFIAATQQATPVFAEVRDGSSCVGCFSGLMISRCGVRILGSPFQGWTTMYMGFNLEPEVPRWMALQALQHFAFQDLGCLHFEVTDRLSSVEDGERSGLKEHFFNSYTTDLRKSEEQIFAEMEPTCRTCIRKAQRNGVVIEESCGDDLFVDEYYEQLKDVFAKKGLVPTYSRNLVRLFIRHLYPTGNLLLLRARDPDGKCIATGLFPGMNKLAQFWGNASVRSGQHLRPNQAMHWYAIRYWRAHGAECFDWGGGGTYKEKYGSQKILVHRFCKSRTFILPVLRDQAYTLFKCKQRIRGWLAARSGSMNAYPPPAK